MRALKIQKVGQAKVVTDAAKPALRPDYVLVKTVAVALNPTDWKHIGFVDKPATVGCDFAGIVEEVGEKVTKKWKKGDRIAGLVHGSNDSNLEDGSFGEYLVAKGDLQLKIPDNLSDEEAATLGVGIITVGQGLYRTFGLPWPDQPAKEKFPILIYGGSSATGVAAIQWAKLSGLEVITTCSPHNFDFVKKMGADAVFDYSADNVGQQIREYTKNQLFYAYDTIAEKNSFKICEDALSSNMQPSGKKPQYCGILQTKLSRDDVDVHFTLGYEVFGEDFEKMGRVIKANPAEFEHAKKVFDVAQKLYAEGKLKPHRYDVRPGGLDGILDGLKDMKEGKVSGTKLVYCISQD